ncbi:hypothetical protein, partial [Xanthomonas vasicola]|uniref:hypothetical protein n=1 Tax=Xanthomonas vasicola TaxID=56459 RepID=UPI001B80A0F6
RNRQKIGDLSALSAADAVASFSGRVDQTILNGKRREQQRRRIRSDAFASDFSNHRVAAALL